MKHSGVSNPPEGQPGPGRPARFKGVFSGAPQPGAVFAALALWSLLAAAGLGAQTPPLYWAALNNDLPVLARLPGDTDWNQTLQGGWTALTLAASRGHERAVELLLDRGGNPLGFDAQGRDLWLAAVQGLHPQVGLALRRRGLGPGRDSEGGTLLHRLVRAGEARPQAWLLARRFEPDRDALDSRRQSALDLARSSGNPAALEILSQP